MVHEEAAEYAERKRVVRKKEAAGQAERERVARAEVAGGGRARSRGPVREDGRKESRARARGLMEEVGEKSYVAAEAEPEHEDREEEAADDAD